MSNFITKLIHAFRLHSAARNDERIENETTLFERPNNNFRDTCSELNQHPFTDSFGLYNAVGALARKQENPEASIELLRSIAKINPATIEVVGNPDEAIAPLFIDRARILSEKFDSLQTSPQNIQEIARPLLPSRDEIMACLQRAIGNTAASRLIEKPEAYVL